MISHRISKLCILICILSVFTLILCCDNPSNVESPINSHFIKYYGEDGDQEAVDMVINADGTIMILGHSIDNAIFLVKADAAGNKVWTKKLGTTSDIPKDIEPTLNGNYIIVSDFLQSTNNKDVKLILVNNEGVKIDSVIHGTLANDEASSVTYISDGGCIVVGVSAIDWRPEDNVNRSSSIFHFRFDANLEPFDSDEWKDFFGSGVVNSGVKLIQATDNSLYVFGYTNSTLRNPEGKIRLVYYRLNPNGLLSSNDIYLGHEKEDTRAAFIVESPPSLQKNYFIVSTSNKGTPLSKLRVSKLRDPLLFTNNDDELFDQNITYGGKVLEGVSASPSLTSPQGFLIVSNEFGATGGTDVLLSKVDQSGGELWSVNFGSEKNDRAAAVAELPDGKILVLCTIESELQKKIALLKLNAKGQLLK